MKTRIVTAVSIVGVLGAGSAAALVNTQILDSAPTESGASAAVLPEPASIELTVPATTLDTTPTSTVVVSTVPTTTLADAALLEAAEATTTVPGPSGFLTAFNVGDAGVVTVDVVDGQLVLIAAEPKPGWTVTKAEDDSNDDSDEIENEVEVEFRSATVRVEFEAAFVDGQIVPKVESRAIGGTASSNTVAAAPNTTTAPPNTYDDDDRDDDRDEYEDDDRDEDEYEDDDHDEDDHDEDDHDDDHEEDDRDDD